MFELSHVCRFSQRCFWSMQDASSVVTFRAIIDAIRHWYPEMFLLENIEMSSCDDDDRKLGPTSLEPSSHWDIGWKFSSWQPPTMGLPTRRTRLYFAGFHQTLQPYASFELVEELLCCFKLKHQFQTLGFQIGFQLCTNSWAICFDNFWVALAPSIQLPMECCFWDMTWTRLDYKQTKPMRNFQGFTNQSLMCMGKGWM